MYNSPINRIFDDIQYQITVEGENQIMEAVQKCNIIVNKDELVKALNYDRNQYEKGYKDAIDGLPIIEVAQSISQDHIEQMVSSGTLDDYKEFVKRQLCRELGEYLYEHNLVTYTEREMHLTPHDLVIRASIKISKMDGIAI